MWHLESCPKRKIHNIDSPSQACRIALIVEGTTKRMECGRAATQFQLWVWEVDSRMFPCSGADHRILVWYQLKRWGKCFWSSSGTRKQEKDKTCTLKMKVNGCLRHVVCTHFQSGVCQQRLLVLEAVGCGRVGAPLAMCAVVNHQEGFCCLLCTSRRDGKAVNLHPSPVLVDKLLLPFEGPCSLGDADLLLRGPLAGGGVVLKERCPLHGRRTAVVFPVPETRRPLASAWQEGEHCLVFLLPKLETGVSWVPWWGAWREAAASSASSAFQGVYGLKHDLGKDRLGEHPWQNWPGRKLWAAWLGAAWGLLLISRVLEQQIHFQNLEIESVFQPRVFQGFYGK